MSDSQALPHWAFEILKALALTVGGGASVKLITLWQNRKKPAAETKIIEAQALEIRVRSNADAGDSVARLVDKMALMQESFNKALDELRDERDSFKRLSDKYLREVEFHEMQMKRIKGFLDSKGLSLSELDKR